MPLSAMTENICRSARHMSFYLESGPSDGTPIIFIHGWPELSLSWRHQLPLFGALGFHAIAPDLRGHGRSAFYDRHDAYALQEIVEDMLELLDAIGARKAIWVGHDWGAPVVWNIASHHPEKCIGVAALNLPYRSFDVGVEGMLPLLNRDIYPVGDYPYGNFEYYRYYSEHFDRATQAMEADVDATFKLLFRAGSPDGKGKPTPLSEVRRNGGWFGGRRSAPDLPRDGRLLGEAELRAYATAYKQTGFFGTDSLYMNDRANAAYASTAVNGGHLGLPVLFLEAEFDYVCDTVTSRLSDPMRALIANLTVKRVPSGHWMAQECPAEVNAHLTGWLATQVPEAWPFATEGHAAQSKADVPPRYGRTSRVSQDWATIDVSDQSLW